MAPYAFLHSLVTQNIRTKTDHLSLLCGGRINNNSCDLALKKKNAILGIERKSEATTADLATLCNVNIIF